MYYKITNKNEQPIVIVSIIIIFFFFFFSKEKLRKPRQGFKRMNCNCRYNFNTIINTPLE